MHMLGRTTCIIPQPDDQSATPFSRVVVPLSCGNISGGPCPFMTLYSQAIRDAVGLVPRPAMLQPGLSLEETTHATVLRKQWHNHTQKQPVRQIATRKQLPVANSITKLSWGSPTQPMHRNQSTVVYWKFLDSGAIP